MMLKKNYIIASKATKKRINNTNKVLIEAKLNPGVCVSEIVDRLQLARETICHHVRKLEKDNKIIIVNIGRRARIVPFELQNIIENKNYLAEPLTRRAIEMLFARGPIGPASLARLLNCSAPSINKRLKLLKKNDIVDKYEGFHPLYKISPGGRIAVGHAKAISYYAQKVTY